MNVSFVLCENEIVKRILFEKSLTVNQIIGQNSVARWLGERCFCVCENEIVKRILFETSFTVNQIIGQKKELPDDQVNVGFVCAKMK